MESLDCDKGWIRVVCIKCGQGGAGPNPLYNCHKCGGKQTMTAPECSSL